MQSSYELSTFLIILITTSSLPKATHGNAEVSALMEIKASLDPTNKYLSSWTSNGDPCSGTFEGVACNEHRKVANISLQGKGLTGKVPAAVAELKCLSGLYLHYNSLTGEIPKEIANLTELIDLYLNVNNLSGTIPSQIGSMASLQVLQLCCNQLTGSIPTEMGFLKKLNVFAMENNQLTGQIPLSLGDLGMLKRLYLSFNLLSGTIPTRLASLPQLEVLDVRNNTLSGVVPPALRRLNEFHFGNNPGLCGVGFSSLRACTAWDNLNINQAGPPGENTNRTVPKNIPQTATFPLHCNQTHCSKLSSKLPQIGIVAGVIAFSLILMVVGFLGVFMYRRRKQKVGNTSEFSDDRHSVDQAKDSYKRSPSPLAALEYPNGWDPITAGQDCSAMCHEIPQGFKFNLEEVESATQHFSDVNLLGKSNFSAVYKGILKDGSAVAVKSINKMSCKSEEEEFIKGLSLITSLKHDNLVKLRGFCCSKARGECFLIYDFAPKGNLSWYLDTTEDDNSKVLDWSTRVSIINGIAKGLGYLHVNETSKSPIIHQNMSVEKVLLDQHLNPLIMDSGLLKLLADDVFYSTLKVSAALGYMAPEYITTGRFTEKSDVYAFGVIILQVLTGQSRLPSTSRLSAEAGKLSDFIDPKLEGRFSETEAARLVEVALNCTNELPESRPTVISVIHQLSKASGT